MGDPSKLGLVVHRHVYELAGRARRLHQPADRGPLVTRPASEIQDHVRSQFQRLQPQPEQPSFQHIALPGRLRIAEQREHPLIRCQPQRAVLLGQLSRSRGLSGPGQADRQEQRRHARILSRRPSDHGLRQRRIEAAVGRPNWPQDPPDRLWLEPARQPLQIRSQRAGSWRHSSGILRTHALPTGPSPIRTPPPGSPRPTGTAARTPPTGSPSKPAGASPSILPNRPPSPTPWTAARTHPSTSPSPAETTAAGPAATGGSDGPDQPPHSHTHRPGKHAALDVGAATSGGGHPDLHRLSGKASPAQPSAESGDSVGKLPPCLGKPCCFGVASRSHRSRPWCQPGVVRCG